MINRIMGSGIPKAMKIGAGNGGGNGDRLTKFLRSKTLGKVLDTAEANPVICQSGFALALCCVARPATNFLVTEDKQDAAYASCHSISSGGIGFIWPLLFATPLAAGVKKVAANPQKYLKPEVVKKFYPNVALEDIISKDGKKIGKKVKTNVKGEMLREDGTVLCKSLEPKMIYNKEERAAFEAKNAGFYVDKNGVVRSKTVFNTEGGKFKLDENGNKIGCAVQNNKEMTPITEEMEIGARKEKNVTNFINMSSDILLAPPRAALTIALIPSILKNVFGVQKSNNAAAPASNPTASSRLDITSKSNNTVKVTKSAGTASPFSSFKKGGV
ncbi:MAG: hypothetical protein LUB59_06100 [Candidatus Gastranaerophilales bacterium]|nr:hypothetical protein [Candidatus Gastranaerophilales bacterium]